MSSPAEPRLGCGAAIVRDGALLLIQRLTPPEVGAWGLPGGKVDLYEPCEDAVRREILEELGIEITLDGLLCVMDQIDPNEGVHWVAPIYLVTAFKGTPMLLEPEKHNGPKWCPLDALPDRLTTPTEFAVKALQRRR